MTKRTITIEIHITIWPASVYISFARGWHITYLYIFPRPGIVRRSRGTVGKGAGQ